MKYTLNRLKAKYYLDYKIFRVYLNSIYVKNSSSSRAPNAMNNLKRSGAPTASFLLY
jgi:hypothetical protein